MIEIPQHSRDSWANEEDIKKSTTCCCYYCLSYYPAWEVHEFTGDKCGICPKCGIDSVLADATRDLPDIDLLRKYHKESFSISDL